MQVKEAIEQRRAVKHYDATHRMREDEIEQLMTLAQLSPTDYLESLRLGLSVWDVGLVLIKGALFGLGTAGVCCWAGLRAARTPAAIPQSVTRGVVVAMVYVFGVSALFTVVGTFR